MTDIYDAIARGFRYPSRFEDGFWEEELNDDYDEIPPAPLALSRAQRVSLGQAIDVGLGGRGCDGTLRATEAWARRESLPWEPLRRGLEDHGGFCDCEVVLNALAPPG
jgi:Protein of unknown function (DUF2695)